MTASVSHIGRGKRERFIYIPASALPKSPELPPNHPVEDGRHNPVTDDEPGCETLVFAEKSPYLMLQDAFGYYAFEHLVAEGRDPKRMLVIAKHAYRIWTPQDDITKIDRPATRHYIAMRQADGVKGATIRRELSLIQAAMNHNVREETSRSFWATRSRWSRPSTATWFPTTRAAP